MHIAIVTRNMSAGGAERVISQLLKEWISEVECSLILIEKKTIYYDLPAGVHIHEYSGNYKNRIFNKLKQYKFVRNIVAKNKPDVILSLPEEIGIYVLIAMLGTGVPVVVSERNDPWVMPNKRITRFFRKLMYPFAKGLIFQTEQAASFFSKNIRNKSVVLDNPLDLSRIPEAFTGKREKTIVGAGRLVPQKNFHLLIDAFSMFHIKHPEYKLIIYGEGPQRDELEKYLEHKHLKDVVFLPGLSKTLLFDISKAAMFVLSSDYEGVPNVLIEAMALGMPVVSTDCRPGGAAHLIENTENGLLVPIQDITLLSDAMCWIVENEDKAISMGKAALNIKNRFNSINVCKQWLEFFKTFDDSSN